MLRIGIFCLIAPFGLIEMFLYHRYDIVLVGTLYLALSIQADFAAGRYLRETFQAKNGPRRRLWNEEPETEELHVPPLGAARAKADTTYYPPPPLREVPPPAAEAPPPRERRRVPRGFHPQPDFHGQAHEVLGVSENAATRTIVHAFRHWIKRFHPDQARDLAPELANARVRQLTDAKEHLLQRRRSRRA